jgi:hypothetical protein
METPTFAESWSSGTNDVAIARPRHGKHLSAATNAYTSIDSFWAIDMQLGVFYSVRAEVM